MVSVSGAETAERIIEREVRELVRRRGLDPGNGGAAAVRSLIDEVVADYGERGLTASMPPLDEPEQVAKTVADRVVGFGPLQPYLEDPEVEELWVNGPDKVFVARAGRPILTSTVLSEQQVHDLVEQMLRASGRRLDLSSPFVDAALSDGSRLHVVIPDIARRHWAVNVRKFVVRETSLGELVRLGMMTPQCSAFLAASVVAGLNIVAAGGNPNAWETPRPADSHSGLDRWLIIDGGFRVDDGRRRQLEERSRALGFADLHACLQTLSDAGYSLPRLAQELGTTQWLVSQALTDLDVRQQPRPERLATQRRRAAEERIAARVGELGFADAQAYLSDRVAERGWLLSAVVAELGADPAMVGRLLDRFGVRRWRRTEREQAALARGRRVQAELWQARRAARLGELGFADLASYLRVRRVEQGWSVRRMRAELGVGKAWLVGEMRRLGIKP